MILNTKNFKFKDSKLYCTTHTPVDRASTGGDSIANKNALNAPKAKAEGLGTAQKGTGDKPTSSATVF